MDLSHPGAWVRATFGSEKEYIMTDTKNRSPLQRLRDHTKHAVMAGTLAATGCSDQSALPPEEAAIAQHPSASPNLYLDMLQARMLDVSVVVDGQRIELLGGTEEDQRAWEALVQADEPFTDLRVELRDPSGTLEPCIGHMTVPAEYRHGRYLPGIITNERMLENLTGMATQCPEMVKQEQRREVRDPKQWAQYEGRDLQGRIAQAVTLARG